MRPSKITPGFHVFVCANRRVGSPLGPGCGDDGDAVYDAVKREVTERGLVQRVWVTRTHCLGICPKHGATVATYAAPEGARTTDDAVLPPPILTEVEANDARELVAAVEQAATTSANAEGRPGVAELARELDALEELQNRKVLDLARRLLPGMTSEDVQNPHDFPELSDPDWQYADGVRAGIASVKSALAALVARARPEPDEP